MYFLKKKNLRKTYKKQKKYFFIKFATVRNFERGCAKVFRQNLYLFRCGLRLSQKAISEKIGCTRATYSNIEIGKRNGRASFWDNLQKAFDLTPSELEKLKQKAGAENDKDE